MSLDPFRFIAICLAGWINQQQLEAEATKCGSQPKAYHHYHDLLANKDIHAVLIATPEHWHCRMALDAIAVGKDIYLEEPLCHTSDEGRTLVQAEKSANASSRWACSVAVTISISSPVPFLPSVHSAQCAWSGHGG